MTSTETTETAQQIAQQRAAGLRQLADLIEAHPELDASYVSEINVFYAHSKDTLRAIARAGLDFGAQIEKDPRGETFVLRLSWAGVQAKALGVRAEVCTRIKTGEEVITEEVPDPAVIAAAPMVTHQKVVEHFTWKCEPLMDMWPSPDVR